MANRRLRQVALTVLLSVIAMGCSSGSVEPDVLGAQETVVAETTVAPTTTAAPTTTTAEPTTTEAAPADDEGETEADAPAEPKTDIEVMEAFLAAIDAQDYATVLGTLDPEYAGTTAPGTRQNFSAFWIFQVLFDYDALAPADCAEGAAVITCTQRLTDRLGVAAGYEFEATIVATVADGAITQAAFSSTDDEFFIPLLTWAATTPTPETAPCGPGATTEVSERFTEEEIEASLARVQTDFDPDEPVAALNKQCVDYMVDNVLEFAALPDSPPFPGS